MITPKTSQGGFTLAELLVSVTIAALVLSVGVPSFTTVVQNSNQVATANEFLSTLHMARDLAITRNARTTVCPSSAGAACEAVGWDQGWIVFVDTNSDGQVNGGEIVDRAVGDVNIPSIASAQFGNSIIYRPNGRAMAAGAVTTNTGQLTFCDHRGSAHARVAIIDVSGRPRISSELMDGSTPVCPTI